MKEKRLIVSMACGDQSRKYAEFTHPLIQKYAQKCGADFYSMYQEDENYTHLGQQKWKYAELLGMYDRILHVDADVVVQSNCPNLFNIVAPEEFGGVDEQPYANPAKEFPYVDRFEDVKRYSGLITPKFYINVGVYLFSSTHRFLFDEPVNLYGLKYAEQTELNAKLHFGHYKTHLLPWNYNYMSMMEWAGLPKSEAYMIHYAGGWGGKNSDVILDIMKKDLK